MAVWFVRAAGREHKALCLKLIRVLNKNRRKLGSIPPQKDSPPFVSPYVKTSVGILLVPYYLSCKWTNHKPAGTLNSSFLMTCPSPSRYFPPMLCPSFCTLGPPMSAWMFWIPDHSARIWDWPDTTTSC